MPFSEPRVRVVIPARFGSVRLPGKPLVDLAGRPMVVRVAESVIEALPEAEVVVAVDDQRILDVLGSFNLDGLMTSTSCLSGTDRAAEVARSRGWGADDLVINVQGDEPLLPADLLRAFALFCVSESIAMATVSAPVATLDEVHDPNVVKLMVRSDDTAITFSRSPIPFDRDREPSQWMLDRYLRHLGLYAYRNGVLQSLTSAAPSIAEETEKLEQLRALWIGIPIHVMRWFEAPPGGVDTPEDVRRVSAVLEGVSA
ncbi:3-deoxy-manno-octulosonate cytidylyltransferase [Nocardioides cavernaquae]|nr:3-deoxy-manno-octulosonate cytidylyltransferase [Nocardioides cavernaquae]